MLPVNAAVSIVLPCYAEVEALRKLLPVLRAFLPEAEVLVVWDGPDDGTKELCWQQGVVPFRGEGKGLGAAILLGIQAASHDLVIVMDGDGQHPIHTVQQIAEALQSGYQMVFGIRTLKSHTTFARELIGLFMRVLARPITDLSDPMGGLFGVDRRILAGRHIHANSWKIGLEIAALCKDAKSLEIPFIFQERIAGESKASVSTAFAYFRQLASLAWRVTDVHDALVRFFKFGLVGASGVGVNLGIFDLLLHLSVQYNLAGVMSFVAAVISNYSLNRVFTFRDSSTAWTDGLWKFILICLAGLGMKQAVMTGLVELAQAPVLAGAIVGIGAGSVINYIGSKQWAFKPTGKASNVLAS